MTRMKLTHKLIILWLICLAYAFIMKSCEAQELTASWYSISSLHHDGQWKITKGVMANGQRFSDDDLTCAARLWPLGTRLVVTNKANGKSVTVKVTDRIGKRFSTKRIDLSKTAFMVIGNLDSGIIPVSIDKEK